ncbi:HAD family hydrolase [Thalassobius sp. I31.1]|uniref:HAD family hydrolase n=1 Tax=Thalassobius sp. I31.1 TaxID=2109912 RepID=UPI000D1A3B54|nr:HAD family hydrolase [Thalassobius sp. I31.1]
MSGKYGGKLQTIAFDADDTLWQNESFFRLTQDRFADLLKDYAEADHLEDRLLAAERRNIGHYGFGVKGFTLSMIETAIEVTEERVPARVIRELIEAGQDMLAHPIHLLVGVQDVLKAIAPNYNLMLITKGDLLDQERKLAQSGLGDFFDAAEIVSDKNTQTYRDIFHRHGCDPAETVMIGNSVKSDVIPPIDAGAWGIWIPYGVTWALEEAESPTGHPRYLELRSMTELPQALRTIQAKQ